MDLFQCLWYDVMQPDKEGEAARTLEKWRNTHKEFFSKELAEKGKLFTEDAFIVCKEFVTSP